jgi:purine operon repressor
MKIKRTERIAVITKALVENPGKTFNLSEFSDRLDSAKSSISEDIMIIREAFLNFKLGEVETIPGAAGGVTYRPKLAEVDIHAFLKCLIDRLNDPKRIIPGGFIYMTDIIFDPAFSEMLGKIFATLFYGSRPDCVLTVETKGIPIALSTAKCFNKPLVIVRRDSRVTEGTAVSINYVSGSSRRIQTMSLSRRALKEGTRVLIIDDFMKAGGTARGMIEMMAEFKAEVVGTGVLVVTREPEQKLVHDFTSLLRLTSIDEQNGFIKLTPAI